VSGCSLGAVSLVNLSRKRNGCHRNTLYSVHLEVMKYVQPWAFVGFKESGECKARLCFFWGGGVVPDIHCKRHNFRVMMIFYAHKDKDQLVQCQIYHSMEKNIIILMQRIERCR